MGFLLITALLTAILIARFPTIEAKPVPVRVACRAFMRPRHIDR